MANNEVKISKVSMVVVAYSIFFAIAVHCVSDPQHPVMKKIETWNEFTTDMMAVPIGMGGTFAANITEEAPLGYKLFMGIILLTFFVGPPIGLVIIHDFKEHWRTGAAWIFIVCSMGSYYLTGSASNLGAMVIILFLGPVTAILLALAIAMLWIGAILGLGGRH